MQFIEELREDDPVEYHGMMLPFTPTKVHLQFTVSNGESQKLPSRCAWTSWSPVTVASLAALRTNPGPSLLEDVIVVPHLSAMCCRSFRGSSCIPVSRRSDSGRVHNSGVVLLRSLNSDRLHQECHGSAQGLGRQRTTHGMRNQARRLWLWGCESLQGAQAV